MCFNFSKLGLRAHEDEKIGRQVGMSASRFLDWQARSSRYRST
jgi:hypothetical protein